tara:strand:+ start:284 stop:508 length:225 start_codon:yes stop_codon:yes gene_type:complete
VDDGNEDYDINEMSANLLLDPESRMWKLEVIGSAAFILHFMLDNNESGLTHKLWDEAKFDRLIRYDLGELNEEE